jgi:predicted Rossmann fold nucleotide-binding protein DprA/Smf involved in DNA uptake
LPWRFPRRNRIISGLGRFVLLAEAKARSGALITCRFALEQGKDVWAIPGPVTNPGSIGPLQLIQDGAGLAITPLDILREHPDVFRREVSSRTPPAKAGRGGEDRRSLLFAPAGEAAAPAVTGKSPAKADKAAEARPSSGEAPGKAGKAAKARPSSNETAAEARPSPGEAAALWPVAAAGAAAGAARAAALTAGERSLLAEISYYPVHIDQLLAAGKFPGSTFYLVLTNLLRLRLIEKLPGDYYQRI